MRSYSKILLLCGVIALASCQSSDTGHGHADHLPVLGVHTLQLRDGVSTAQFEAFVAGPLAELWRKPIGGLQVHVQKVDRGDHMGTYQAVWAFDSLATRNRYFPNPTTVTDAWHETVGNKIKDVHDKFERLCTSTEFTDYLVLFESDDGGAAMGPSLDGYHSFELKAGVSDADFEAFVSGAYGKAWARPIAGIGRVVLKGERGAQTGKYKVIIRFTPASLRDRYVPNPSTLSKHYREKVAPLMPHDIENQMRAMTARSGFSDFAPITR